MLYWWKFTKIDFDGHIADIPEDALNEEGDEDKNDPDKRISSQSISFTSPNLWKNDALRIWGGGGSNSIWVRVFKFKTPKITQF